ncbi:MAG: hypothetical protein ACXU8N_14490 [Telluria sp.]
MKHPIVNAMLFAAANAGAQPQPPAPPKDHRGPPPEAIEACKGKQAGDSVTIKTPRGDTLTGTCQLVFMPQRGEGQR